MAADTETLNAATKRKRSDVAEDDQKLKEFLEVMQPPSKAKKWAAEVEDLVIEPPTKIQALELPEGGSDEEYEEVPAVSERKSQVIAVPTLEVPTLSIPETPEENAAFNMVDATDDDWLRSRTNRLLDLMDPEEISATEHVVTEDKEPAEAIAVHESELIKPTKSPADAGDVEEEVVEEEQPDPIFEAIRSNGRLFVRNLPYTATEDDLRKHFAPYGALEEVSSHLFYQFQIS